MGEVRECECGGGRRVRAGKGCAECEQLDSVDRHKRREEAMNYEMPRLRLADVLSPSREDLAPVEVAMYREEEFSLWSRDEAFRELQCMSGKRLRARRDRMPELNRAAPVWNKRGAA